MAFVLCFWRGPITTGGIAIAIMNYSGGCNNGEYIV